MLRILFFTGIFSLALLGESCQSHCKKMAKTNSKLISGKETFGLKNKKFKKQNRRGA
jgi:hypothetical protein